jgi:hypothetical protein
MPILQQGGCKTPRGEHPDSRAVLISSQREKGDPPLDKPGRHRWSAPRKRASERLTIDLDPWLGGLMDRARRGDVAAPRLVLGSILDVEGHQFFDDAGAPMSFANLARKARGSA